MQKYLIGLGNYSMGDDSIGLRIIESIADQKMDSDFEAVEIGHDALRLHSYFNDQTEKILLVDCVKMNCKPGETKVFGPEEVKSVKKLQNFSTHEGDIIKTIELAKTLGHHLPPIRIMGIEPEQITPSMELFPILMNQFDHYIDMAINELRKDW